MIDPHPLNHSWMRLHVMCDYHFMQYPLILVIDVVALSWVNSIRTQVSYISDSNVDLSLAIFIFLVFSFL